MGAVLGAGHQFGEALVPVIIGVVIDRAVSDGDGRALFGWLAVLAAVYVGLSSASASAPAPANAPPNRPRTTCGSPSYDGSSTPAAAPNEATCPASWRTSPPRTPNGSAPSTWPS